MNNINLHIHTTSSDGMKNYKEIIDIAEKLGLKIISITDHDCIESVKKTQKYGAKKNIMVISGVELSADYRGGTCHILGYNINLRKIKRFCSAIKKSRKIKVKNLIKKLNKLGYKISLRFVKKITINNIGRREIAKALVHKGYFKNEDIVIKEVFDKNNNFGFSSSKKSVSDCIKIIKESKGLAILAHPWTLNLNDNDLKQYIKKLKAIGLDGIEVYNHNISDKEYKKLDRICDINKLLKTCGTDYHASKKLMDMVVNKDVDCSSFLNRV